MAQWWWSFCLWIAQSQGNVKCNSRLLIKKPVDAHPANSTCSSVIQCTVLLDCHWFTTPEWDVAEPFSFFSYYPIIPVRSQSQIGPLLHNNDAVWGFNLLFKSFFVFNLFVFKYRPTCCWTFWIIAARALFYLLLMFYVVLYFVKMCFTSQLWATVSRRNKSQPI